MTLQEMETRWKGFSFEVARIRDHEYWASVTLDAPADTEEQALDRLNAALEHLNPNAVPDMAKRTHSPEQWRRYDGNGIIAANQVFVARFRLPSDRNHVLACVNTYPRLVEALEHIRDHLPCHTPGGILESLRECADIALAAATDDAEGS